MASHSDSTTNLNMALTHTDCLTAQCSSLIQCLWGGLPAIDDRLPSSSAFGSGAGLAPELK